ncbi:MAG TPA: M28 family peptidase, partial [Proteobacteria bacterium]|nr:M28 family peptidase [Pseudomonadota bacterium]
RAGVLTIPFFASMLLAALIAVRSSGARGVVMDALSLVANLVVGIGVLLLAEREFSGEPICGANDNASGVAVNIAAARALVERSFGTLEVILVFTGAGEVNASGMQSLIRDHPELVAGETYMVNLDSVGRSPFKVSFAEGPVISRPVSPELVCLALRAAQNAGIELTPDRIRFTSDIYPALVRGAKATTIFGEEADFVRRSPKDRPENIDERSLIDVVRLVCGIARLLEREG